jgi:N-acetylglucosaminyl-diphospho-decaprenol L-rhamnosyltransferase
MPDRTPDISIIIVSYNTCELLAGCLRSIFQAEYPYSREVLVVDNASSDGSGEMVAAQFPAVQLLRNRKNLGFAVANNQALALAGGRCLFLLNSDAAVLPAGLLALRSAFDEHPRLGIVGPALLNQDGSLQPSWGDFPSVWQEFLFETFLFRLWPVRFPYGRRVHPLLRAAYRRLQTVDWVTGAALMLRREVYEQIGGLSEENFMYGEDLEFCARARRAGFATAYVPAAKVYHRQQGSAHGDYGRWIENYTQATLNYFDRYGSPADRRRVATLVLGGSRLREFTWSLVARLWPRRRQEALARVTGYRRAANLARQSRQAHLKLPADS